ncbi:MAG: phosphate ABC transporter ATP-binding protein [Actinomycetota bacterium]
MLDPTAPLETLNGHIVSPPLPVELKGLVYAVGGKRVIDAIDLTIDSRRLTTIMGPNGAGKSLLLRLMHGLIIPTKGEILWGGSRMDRLTIRRQAMVFQRPVLLRRSVAANVSHALGLRGVARGERAIRVDEALKLAGLEGHASIPARVLSGGEQQRLCLARALSLEPDVLFLDEPTSNLDPASTLAIERLLLDAQRRGIKVILVTHDIGQARRLAHDVIFMHHGRVIEHQDVKSFFAEPQSEGARAFLIGGIVL